MTTIRRTCSIVISFCLSFFFFNDTATTEIYTLSLHDALPIWNRSEGCRRAAGGRHLQFVRADRIEGADRKSTRLNSSHSQISYAVFCLKKKKKTKTITVSNKHQPHASILHHPHLLPLSSHPLL